MTADLRSTLAALSGAMGLQDTASEASEQALLTRLAEGAGSWDNPLSLARSAAILEAEALAAYRSSVGSNAPTVAAERQRAEALFAQSGACLRLLAKLRTRGVDVSTADDDSLPGGLDLPFRVAVSSMVARRTSDVRLELADMVVRGGTVAAHAPGFDVDTAEWDVRLLADTFGAFVLLVRKQDGWEDINAALGALDRLRIAQDQLQATYLARAQEEGRAHERAARLVGLFHLAQMVTLSGQYLRDGQNALPALTPRLDRHRDHAREALTAAGHSGGATMSVLTDLLWAGCRELVRNSIWAHVEGLGDQVARFASQLADKGRPRPVLELWPSQQEALAANVLDQYRRAVLVQMPTSAGKTLLAEFLIIQSHALLPSATVAYVVPTRALVNQVTRDLRADLGPLGLSVEQAVPAYELDPAEQAMLSDPPAVLVTTPEKLSLLIRRDDPSVANVGLLVVDEAHSLGDGQRGARLELLLATVRRDRPGARYLLLSPFLPNAQQLVDWLGDDRGLPPVTVNWRPGRRVVGVASVAGRRPHRELLFETLDAAGGADLSGGHKVRLSQVSNADLTGAKSIKAVTRLSVKALRDRGTALVLCYGPGHAMTRSAELAEGQPILPSDPLRDAIARYFRAEYGEDLSLSRNLLAGFAYHHAGMSQEARLLVECLVRRGLVHTVCGTTTLAQGVNFPISTVLIETTRKGERDSLSYEDLWNIIGRAGRALLDDSGLVVFPVAKAEQAVAWQEFLRSEARDIASQLTSLVDQADRLSETIGLGEVRRIPELGEMLQFLAHAMRVGGARQTAAELEDLLRSSLVYRQAGESSERSETLVRLCRRYLAQIADQPGRAALSDQTGFSTPTLGMLLGKRNDDPSLTDLGSWQPNSLFGEDHNLLTARMRVLGEVPELGLGWEAGGTFNPWRAGRIVAGWVNGKSLADLTDEFGETEGDREKNVATFARNLYSNLSYKASWGLGALETAYLPSGEQLDATDPARYVPSMVYFGVGTPEAVWMRMAGLPRVAAEGAGALWAQRIGQPPRSHAQLRAWVTDLSIADWGSAVAAQPVDGADMKRLWDSALG